MANNPKADKGTFILRADFYPQVQLLTREQRGDLLTAIFAYTSEDTIPDMDGVTKMCFEFIKASIDFYAEKYDAQCRSNRENGRKGGRPRKTAGIDANQPDQTETVGKEENPTESEKTERFFKEPTESNETGRMHGKPNENNETEWITQKTTESEKTVRPKKNRYSYCECDSDCDNSTHTVRDEKEGGAGETIADPTEKPANVEAARLLAWIAANVPTVAGMAEPLTEQNIVWMLRKYSVEDIQRIIRAMHNKRAYENVSAYATFTNFAKYDKELAERKALGRTASSGPHRYSHSDYLTMIDRQNGGKYRGSDFTCIREDGLPYWVLTSEMKKHEA